MSDNLPDRHRPHQQIQFYADTEPGVAGPRLGTRNYSDTPPPDEIGLEDLGHVIRRQWWVILSVMVAVVASAAAYTWLQTPVWMASSLIRVEEESMGAAAAFFPEMAGESELETEMVVAETRPVLGEVVEDLSLNFRMVKPEGVPRAFIFSDIELQPDSPEAEYDITRLGPNRYRIEEVFHGIPQPAREFRAGETVNLRGGWFVLASDSVIQASGAATPPEQIRVHTLDFDHAVEDLQGTLTVNRPDRMASVFRLSYEGTDRWLVRHLVDRAAQAFIETRQEEKKTEARSTVAELQVQVFETQAELEAAEDELEAFRQEHQVVALAAEADEEVRRRAQMRTELTALEAERDALQRILTDVRNSGDQAPDYTRLGGTITFINNPMFQTQMERLTEAEARRSEARARWKPTYPAMIAIEEEIAGIRTRMGELGNDYLQSLMSRIAVMQAELTRYGSDLEEIPARELQNARLQRRVTELTTIYATLQHSLMEAEIVAAVEDPSVRVVEPAVLPRYPIKPRKRLNMALAVVMGMMLGLGSAFLREALDKTVRSGDDIGQMLGLSVLSRVPRLPASSKRSPRSKSLVALNDGTSVTAEAYRTLRSSIFFSDPEGNGKKELVVTSPGARDGKSVTSCNLAITFAQQGLKTLLVDADLRRSTLHLTFELDQAPGLSEYLTGEIPANGIFQSTKVPNLVVVPAGQTPANPAELLGNPKMDLLLAMARDHFDAIVLDSPPVLAVTDATVLANKVSGVVLVVRSDQTHKKAAEDALDQLRLLRARVLGVVVNATDGGGRYGYRYSYYHKYYGKGRKGSR